MGNFLKIQEFKKKIDLASITGHTIHWDTERKQRDLVVQGLIQENEHIIKSFSVDKGHPNGEELHCVTSSGLIFILNKKRFLRHERNPLITVLIARKGQIIRLYHACHLYAPKFLIDLASEHEMQGLNYL